MKNLAAALAVALVGILVVAAPATAWKKNKAAKNAQKRAEIDEIAGETLNRLLENSDAKSMFDQSYGYAVFDSRKVALLMKSGGGVGVAVDKGSGQRTYMRMNTLGVGVGLGIELFQAVFLFEDKARFTQFVEEGWAVESTGSATAGEASVGAHASATDTDTAAVGAGDQAGFAEGIAVFRFTEKGLMASADVSGTKYWKYKDLNKN
jgi:lipid-binding SYLF domain-containing protein